MLSSFDLSLGGKTRKQKSELDLFTLHKGVAINKLILWTNQ